MTNLYDSRIYFEIIFNGVATQIIEPDKWNTIQSHIPRDPIFFGFWSDFLDDRYGMRFSYIKTYEPASGLTITGGGELIWSIYNQYGSEAELYFSFGQYNKNVKQEVNRWRINLNTIDDSDFGGVMVDIEKMPFQAKLRARMSAPVTINEYSNMDGGLLTPIPNSNVRLHSKVLPEQTIAISNSPQLTNEYYGNAGESGFNPLLLSLDFSNIVTAELQNVPSAPCALINDGTNTSTIAPNPGYVNVIDSRLFQYSALTSGNLKVICNTTFTYWHWHARDCFGPFGGENPWFCEYQLKQYRNVNGVYTQISSTILSPPFDLNSASPNFYFGDIGVAYIFPDMTDPADRIRTNKIENINLVWEQDGISVNAGDDFYLYIVFSSTPYFVADSIIRQQISNLTNNISFYQDTTYPPSISPAYRIFDVLNQQIEAITGQANALISPFFSYGGFGYNYLVTNGYSIRNFGNLIYKPKKDLASFLNDLQSIFFIGAGIKKINGVEYLYVDYCPSLFQEKTIGTYQTLEWKDNHSKEFCYNKVELGYKKYSALNLIQEDEFCTQGSYLLQFLKTQDNTLTKQSDTIAAGYLLEEQRRNQYLYNQQQSLTNDSDLFIIATSEPCIFNIPYTTLASFGTGAYIQFGFNAGLLAGDTVSILNPSGTPQYFNLTIYRQVQGYPKYISGVLTDQYEVIANGIWSSGTTYNPSNIVADSFNDYTLWICLSTVSSSLPPHSDSSHWYPFLGLYPLTSRLIGTNFVSQVQITPLSPDQVFAERFQPFEICNGVVDPSSIYNGRLSLKHILYNWRPLLGVGLEWVNIFSPDYSVSQIIPTLVRMNALFTSRFWDSEPNKGNIGDIITVEIQREFLSKYLSNGKNLFMPQGLTCKIKIGYDDYNLIRMALTGETNNPDVDFGGLVLQDWQGIWWFCHIIDFKYNFVGQIAEIKAQKVRQVSIPIS